MADSKGIITVIGRKKLCKAHAGDITLPPITQIAWGDGGVTEDGVPKATTGNEISLYNELLKKNISGHMYPVEDETTCRYSGILDKGELTGKEISEMGLYDSDGDLIAYRTFLRKGKDEDIPLIFDMDEVKEACIWQIVRERILRYLRRRFKNGIGKRSQMETPWDW